MPFGTIKDSCNDVMELKHKTHSQPRTRLYVYAEMNPISEMMSEKFWFPLFLRTMSFASLKMAQNNDIVFDVRCKEWNFFHKSFWPHEWSASEYLRLPFPQRSAYK